MSEQDLPAPNEEEVVRFNFAGWGVYEEEGLPEEPLAIFDREKSAHEYIELLEKADLVGVRLNVHPVSARCAMHNHFDHEKFKRPVP